MGPPRSLSLTAGLTVWEKALREVTGRPKEKKKEEKSPAADAHFKDIHFKQGTSDEREESEMLPWSP